MNTQEIHCSECGDLVNLNVARIVDDAEFETDLENVRYLCPVCFIQNKNRAMQESMLKKISTPS